MITRDERQAITLDRMIKAKGKGYLDCVGSYGKTRTTINFTKYVQSLRPTYGVTVIVPTTELKTQWIKELTKREVTNFEVRVINGVVFEEKEIKTAICIVDEAHMFLRGKEFSKIYMLVKSPYFIAMSGTWSEDDKRIISTFLPLIDRVTQREAEENGWVSQSLEYNLGITLSHQERIEYEKINEICDQYFAYFGQDFQDAQMCFTYQGALSYVKRNDLQGGTYEQLAKEYSKRANIWQEYTQRRVSFIHNYIGKIQTVAAVLNALPDRKAITFGASIEAAEKLTSLMSGSKTYHSKITAQEIPNEVCEKYGFKASKKAKVTKLGAKKVRELYILQFNDNTFTRLNTVKAADLGLDIAGCNCSAVYGRNSRPEKNSQREWRSTRYEGDDKIALIFNVYIKNTQDEKWLKNCQKGKRGIINVNSVSELVNDFIKRTNKII